MKSKKLWGGLIAVIIIGVGGFFAWKRQGSKSASFKESILQKGNLQLTILTTGTVLPENRLAIKPPIAGRIEKVLVNEGDKLTQGQILAWISSTERAALLDAARSSGPQELKRWEDIYRPTPVIAPIAGTLILRSVEPGQTFANSDTLFVMSDRLTVRALVDETDMAQVKLGQKTEVVLDAYSQQKIPAKVDQIAYEATTVNNVTTYAVNVLPESPPDFMRSGMTANVTFLLDSKENILLVPTEALRTKNGKNLVTVKDSDGNPVEKEVQLGLTDGKQTEVQSGLNEGETVLIPQFETRESKSNQNSNPFAPSRPRNRGR